MAAAHLQKTHGLDEADAAQLAAAFASLGVADPDGVDAHLAKYGAALSAADWARSLARCPSVLNEPPSVLADRVAQLQTLMDVSAAQAGSAVAKAPSLLQHDPHEMALKVQALQAVMDLPAEEASAQLIIERFSRFPEILERSVDALEAQLSGLAGLLGSDLQRAARMAFKLPALAASSIDELQAQMDTLSRLLVLDTPAVRTLMLRQPSLLSRTQDSLQAKIEAYADLFAPDTGLALAAAPQLLTMSVDAVKSRFELLSQLAELQPAWGQQLEEANVETLAVWLCSSEKKLRRLEVAAGSPKLARLQLYRLLSHSESRWASELASAGVGEPGQQRPAARHTAGSTDGGADGSSGKPKRARGGRRERERKEHVAARAAGLEPGSGAYLLAGGGQGGAPPRAAGAAAAHGGGSDAGAAAGGGSDKPKRPRGGRRERERKERIARREAEAAGGGGGGSSGGDEQHGGRGHAGGGGGSMPGAGPAAGGGGGSQRPRGGRREREKRERREAREAAGFVVVGGVDQGFGTAFERGRL